MFPTLRIWHLLVLNFIPQQRFNVLRVSRSFWSWSWSASLLMEQYIKQSSANSLTAVPGSTTLGRLEIYIRKRSGPRTVPWGTPESTASSLEWQPSIITLWVLDVRKALIQSRMVPDIPQNSSLLMSLRWGTVSNALLKSSTPMSICSLRSRRWYMSWEAMSNCDSQECLLRKPWFTGVRIPWASRCVCMCEHKMCSNSLQATQVSETGLRVHTCQKCQLFSRRWISSCSQVESNRCPNWFHWRWSHHPI